MARILLGLSTGFKVGNEYKISSFFDQLITALRENGNDVLVYIPNYFSKKCFSSENVLIPNIDEGFLRKQIKEFEPELVLTFNNSIYHDILNITDCPIAIWSADSEIFWNQKELIKNNIDRYHFFNFSSDDIHLCAPCEMFGAKRDRTFNIKSATNLKNTNSKKDKNISFIGTCFDTPQNLLEIISEFSSSDDLRQAALKIWQNPFIKKEELLKDLKNPDFISKFSNIDDKSYCLFFSGEKRIRTLLEVSDLGLEIYGKSLWDVVTYWLPSIGICYNKKLVYSAKQNEEIYNTSKICLNINHEQASEGMPFRICDILASGGCLVTSFSPYYKKVFGNDVDIPIFKDSFEAREICKKLLNDEKLRLEIVEASNKAIDKDWRFESRFKQIGDIFNIDMVDKNKEGSLKILYPQYKKDCSIYIKREANKALKGLIKTLPYFIAKKVLK